MYQLYILKCADGTLYTGITTDLGRRLKEHNSTSLGAKYTRTRRPVKLLYSRVFRNRALASREESRIKKLSREKKHALVLQMKKLTKKHYMLQGEVWLYPGESAHWYFVSLPVKTSREIATRYVAVKRGWGSLPVTVQIGQTTWQTSIFPDKKSGCFLLPIKAAVREKEGIQKNDRIIYTLSIRC